MMFYYEIKFNLWPFLACRWNSPPVDDIEGAQAAHAEGQRQAEEGGNSGALRLSDQQELPTCQTAKDWSSHHARVYFR